MSPMPTVAATVTTARAGRYVTQLARHASAMAGEGGHRMRGHGGGNPLAVGEVALHVDQTAERTVLVFDPWGTCTVRAEGERLMLRVDATDEPGLQRIQQIITRDVERFGAREHLNLTWEHADAVSDPAPAHTTASTGRSRRAGVLLAGAGLAAVAVLVVTHLGLGSAIITAGGWWGWTAVGGLILIAVAVIVTHVALPVAALRLRRHRSRDRDNA